MRRHPSSIAASARRTSDEHRAEFISLGTWLVLVHLIWFCDWLPASEKSDSTSSWTRAGQFGDLLGGYVGTIFALISVVLLFLTLSAQRKSAASEAFESRYFELLRMHRDNVAEVEIQGSTGRKVFVLMVREFRAIHEIAFQERIRLGLEVSNKDICQIAYYCLFYGVGPNSTRVLKSSLFNFPSELLTSLESQLLDPNVRKNVKDYRKLGYEPFEGHQSRLGHYFRHLFQCVDFASRAIDPSTSYGYVKTIRAQLSTHEQALLLLNSLAPVGHAWWESEFIQNFRMVQNLPKDFFDPQRELDLTQIFSFDPLYFEWQETAA